MICERLGFADFTKVLDFGLAKRVGPKANDPGLSSPNLVVGTPHFMAPEAAYGDDGFGPPADVYGVGLLGYFLLTGKTVFDGSTLLALAFAHASEPPVPPSLRTNASISPTLERVIMRCLSKKPEDRFADGAELLATLEQVTLESPWDPPRAADWWKDVGRGLMLKLEARRDKGPRTVQHISLAATERLVPVRA